jgi:hypothetical protein
MWSILVAVAVWHGLVLLPVINSWIGPASYRAQEGDEEASSQHGGKDAARKAEPV